MSTLNKQIWIDQIKEKFYPNTSFLNYAKNFDTYVDNDIINMADAGFDPDVLINNTTYPIAIKQREDKPLSFELDLFETENTLVRNPEAVELAYNKMESVIYNHRMVLQSKTAMKAAHAYAPDGDSEFTPLVVTTGDDNGDGHKRLKVEDILRLKRRFDAVELPPDQRFLVLDANHTEDLILHDLKAFKDITDFVNGKPKRFAGFNILEFTRNPKYDTATLAKVPFGAVADPGHTFCSFAFSGHEVMRADGQYHMYERANDPELRGTVVGFDKRFIALPIRNKGIGALISGKVV